MQTSIALGAAGIVLASVMPGSGTNDDAAKLAVTKQRLEAIQEATKKFMATNYRRPCPGNGTVATSNASFGTETTTPGTCTGANFGPATSAYTGLITSYPVGGIVPVRALGLPDEYALDGYGRRFTYIVDRQATSTNGCRYMQSTGTRGMVKIKAASTDVYNKDLVMAAIISHGKDGHGAFPANGSTVANRINTYTTDTNTLANAFVNSSFTYVAAPPASATFTGLVVQREASSTYDDLTYYDEATKNTCCIGMRCSQGFRIDGQSTDSLLDVNGRITYASGDIDGNGTKDLVISNHDASDSSQTVSIIYNTTGSISDVPAIWTVPPASFSPRPDGSTVWSISKDEDIDYFGYTLAVGDITGDGHDDIFIAGSGRAFIFHTPPIDTTGSSTIGVAEMIANGWVEGVDINHPGVGKPGAAVIADIDADGYKDVIFSTEQLPSASGVNAGPDIAVIWGRDQRDFSKTIDMSDPSSVSADDGLYLYSGAAYPFNALNHTIATGNINGDSYTDIVFGGPAFIFPVGAVFSVFGRDRGSWGSPHDIDADITGGTNGLAIYDDSGGFYLGYTVAVADINKDGYDDIISPSNLYIMAFNGKSTAWTSPVGTATGSINYAVDIFSNKPAAATIDNFDNVLSSGDVNNDGRPDIILSSPSAYMSNAANAGMTYVLFNPTTSMGHATTGFSGIFQMFTAANNGYGNFNGTKGFVIEGYAGDRAHAAKLVDINGDKKLDIIIAAPGYDDDGDYSSLYVVYGRTNTDWRTRYTSSSATPPNWPKIDLTDMNQ